MGFWLKGVEGRNEGFGSSSVEFSAPEFEVENQAVSYNDIGIHNIAKHSTPSHSM